MRGRIKKGRIILLLVAVFAVVFSFGFVDAVTKTCYNCVNCTAEIKYANAGDIVQLDNDINDYSGTCISFNLKDDIIFDCQNHLMDGDASWTGYGIYLNNTGTDGTTNSIIRNCKITQFYEGVYMLYSHYNTLVNISSVNNYYGVDTYTSSNNNITNITVENATNYGININEKSQNNTLTNITISNSSIYGIYLHTSSNLTTLRNVFVNNVRSGMEIFASSNNTLDNITIINSSAYFGLKLGGLSKYNLLDNLTILNNTEGLFVYYSHQNIIKNIVTQGNVLDLSFGPYSTSCDNNLTNITGSGWEAIEFYNYSVNLQNKELPELALCGAYNSSLRNITIKSTDSLKNNGLLIYHSPNVTISIVNSSNNYYGVYLYNISNSTVQEITAKSNNLSGVYLASSRGNNFTNITCNSNFYGILLDTSSNNILSNFSTKWNGANGINTTSGAGVYFIKSNNNTIMNSQIRHNYKEALYLQMSNYTNLTNSIIENHSNGGMRFINSTKNVIYNNFMNNSLNYNDTTSSGNFFNITITLGTNIVGGKYIGGNYWDDMNGTGFSEYNCTDLDGNDICDGRYDLSDGNYDHLPLALIAFSLPEVSASSGGSTSSTAETPQLSQTTAISSISPEEPTVVDITDFGFGARRITINVNNFVSDVSLTVTEVNADEAGFKIGFSGISYDAFEITAVNLSNENIKNTTIEFRVNKTELSKHNLTSEDVFLYRRPVNETQWAPLNTTYLYDEDSYSTFSAVSPGFSTFLIFVSKTECIPAERRCVENDVQFCLGNKKWLVSEVCDYKCVNGACVEKGLQVNLNPLIVYPVIGIIVVGVLVSFIAQRIVSKQKNRYLSSSNINKKFENYSLSL